jgi:hypothetical protein
MSHKSLITATRNRIAAAVALASLLAAAFILSSAAYIAFFSFSSSYLILLYSISAIFIAFSFFSNSRSSSNSTPVFFSFFGLFCLAYCLSFYYYSLCSVIKPSISFKNSINLEGVLLTIASMSPFFLPI